jgi:hypothetical protein
MQTLNTLNAVRPVKLTRSVGVFPQRGPAYTLKVGTTGLVEKCPYSRYSFRFYPSGSEEYVLVDELMFQTISE